jgi:alanyl-tRNA synthetase
MTKRLFEHDPHLFVFTAKVLACEKTGKGFAAELDQSAFYPEGGGQPGDTGTLGGVRVNDTVEKDGRILHLCDAALTVGETVEGRVDEAPRLARMREHTGEHILSGLIYRHYGFRNVGFHMGAETVTLDVDGELDREQLSQLQREANEIVRQNVPVEGSYPSAEELEALDYRSKKKLTGKVRIVSVPGADCCACCGVHVTHTGEVGLIFIQSSEKLRGGTRIELLCGEKAERYCAMLAEQSRRIGAQLSAKATQTADAVERLAEENEKKKAQLAGLSKRLFSMLAEARRDKGNVLLLEPGLSSDDTRRLADAVARVCGGSCAVFSEQEGRYLFAAISEKEDLRPLCAKIREELSGAGGGKPDCVMGSVRADAAEIRAFFAREGWQ